MSAAQIVTVSVDPELAAEIVRQRNVIRKANAYADHLGMNLRDIKRERDDLRDALQAIVNVADSSPFMAVGHLIEHALPDTRATLRSVRP